jgi:hypothetical protein
MPRTTLAGTAVKTPKGPSPGTVNAGDLHIAGTAADSGNGNQFVPAAGDLLKVRNSHATTARTFTLTSAADERGRLGHVTTYSLAAGEEAYFHFGDLMGWKQADGFIYLDASTTDIVFTVLRRPS